MSQIFGDQLAETLPHLRAFARMLTGAADTADDLVQETLVRALAASAQFTPGTNLKAWLFTIMRNCRLDGLRKLQRVRFETMETAERQHCSVPATQTSMLEFAEVATALEGMSEEHKEVLILVAAGGMSHEDAAVICGCAVGTVKSRLSRARAELERRVNAPPAVAAGGPDRKPPGARTAKLG